MYKEMIISIIIVITIFSVDYFVQNYTKNNIELINKDLQETKQSLKEKNEEKIKEKIEKTENDWKKIKNKFACLIEHNELNKVEINFNSSKSLATLREYDMAINKIDESIFALVHINERYKLSLENIF